MIEVSSWAGCWPPAKAPKSGGVRGDLAPCIVAVEACSGAHHLGRLFGKRGHEVRRLTVKSPIRLGSEQAREAMDPKTIQAGFSNDEDLDRRVHAFGILLFYLEVLLEYIVISSHRISWRTAFRLNRNAHFFSY